VSHFLSSWDCHAHSTQVLVTKIGEQAKKQTEGVGWWANFLRGLAFNLAVTRAGRNCICAPGMIVHLWRPYNCKEQLIILLTCNVYDNALHGYRSLLHWKVRLKKNVHTFLTGSQTWAFSLRTLLERVHPWTLHFFLKRLMYRVLKGLCSGTQSLTYRYPKAYVQVTQSPIHILRVA
jgi:hypothetical protein